MEAFPAEFCRGIRSYWRRRKYQRLEGGGKKSARVARLGGGAGGGGRGPSRRFWRLRRAFRVRLRMLSPLRLLARLRDAYVDAMLSLAGKGSALSAPNNPEAVWARRIPRARPARSSKKDDFELRLAFEIYRALAASGDIPAA